MAQDPTREKLHSLLKTLAPNVYFQPPQNAGMKYPCIVYHRDLEDIKYASNIPYNQTKRWRVTVVDQNPDSHICEMVAALPMCRFTRAYTANNLNHDVYNLYF